MYQRCQVDGGTIGQVATSSASVAWSHIKKVLPTKPSTIAALCVAGVMTAKTLWTRYITLRKIDEKIKPRS